MLDLVKLISSIFVISIHSNALRTISPLANSLVCNGIARLAVPFFFTCSAFLFFKSKTTKEKTIAYSRRILTLYLSWFVVMLPITVYDRFIVPDKPFLRNLLTFFQSIFLSSTFSGSWFLTSCIFCVWLFFFIEKRKIPRAAVIGLCCAAYLFCCLSSGYGNLIPKIGLSGVYEAYRALFLSPYTSIIVGASYFALGKHFAECERKNSFFLSVKSTAVCLFASVLLLLGEVYFCKKAFAFGNNRLLSDAFPLQRFSLFTRRQKQGKNQKRPHIEKNINGFLFLPLYLAVLL